MADRTVTVKLDANVREYTRSVNNAADATDDLRRKAERFSGRSYRAKLEVEIPTRALAELAALNGSLNRVDGRRTARVSVSGGRGMQRDLALILNSIAALGPAAVTAAAVASGALLALGSTVGIVAAGIASAGLAFSGMGDLMKAMGQADLKSGENSVAAAADRKAATKTIDDARTAVVRAEADQARAAKAGAREIVDARSAVTKASEDAATANAEAASKVEDAAEDEAVAHQRVRYALEDLSVARKAAIRDMEDMRERSSDLALDERDANVRLLDARDDLTKAEKTAGTSARDLEKARIALARAEDNLSDVQLDRTRQTADLTAAEQKGVEGMDGVVQARRNVEDADRGSSAATEALTKAKDDQVRTEKEGAAKVATAVQALADARDSAALQNQDSADRVADAQGRLEDAMATATAQMSDQTTTAKKLAEELSKISPAGEAFANYLYSLKPKLKELQGIAQAGMFPGMEDGIRNLMQIFPNVANLVDKASTALGTMARKTGEALNSPFWRTYIDFLAAEAGPIMDQFGKIVGGIVEGLSGMQMAFNPMARDMLGGMGRMAQQFADWGTQLGNNDGFHKFVDYVEMTGPVVIDTLGALGGAIGDIAVAAAPIGPVVLKVIEGIANAIGFIARLPGVGTTLIAVGVGMGALNMALRTMQIASMSRMVGLLGTLPGRVATAGTGLGVMALNMGASNRAATGLATAGAKVGTALGKIGGALPIIGAAAIGLSIGFDELSDKSGEFAANVVSGSSSMQDAINDERNSIEKRNFWLEDTTPLIDDEEEARGNLDKKIRDNLNSLTGEARARGEVAVAQAEYDQALKDFGAGSDITLGKQRALTDATNAEADARRRTADTTRDQAGALRDLQNDQMAMLDADLGMRTALQGRKEAQEALTTALKTNKAGSDEVVRANQNLEQSDLQVLRASDSLTAANLVNAGAADTSRIAAFNHTNTLLAMASGINGVASPAIVDIAAKMTDSEIQTHNTDVVTQGLDFTVRHLPDGRMIKIATDSAVRETENTATLIEKLNQLPLIKDIKVNANGTYTLGDGTVGGGARNSAPGFVSGHADGGILPGYTPGRDVHSFVGSAGTLNLSGGEAIMRPEWTSAVGAGFVDRMNSAARAGGVSGVRRELGFAAGGVYPSSQFGPMVDDLQADLYKNIAEQAGKVMAGGGNALAWAATQVGKPYLWGGVGPNGYDCSGFMAAIMNVMDGQSPYRRRGTTGTFPWPGMVPGMGPGLSVGSTKNAGGGIGHMAGTIGGVNVESRGGRGVVVGPEARGAMDRLFTTVYHMPPPAGGGGFGGGNSFAIEGGGAAATQVQQVAARYGWGGGPEWAAIDWIINHESSWNPNARNPNSSAAGLFQKMQSINGPVEETPGGQAEWGLNYIRGRYGSPQNAQRFWQAHGWYDDGGMASGKGYMPKNVVAPERVLSPRQTVAFEQLVSVLSRPRPVSYVAAPSAVGAAGTGARTVQIKNENHFSTAVDLDLFNQRQEFAISSSSF